MHTVFEETEHQELFYLHADLRRPVPIHVPSALGPIGYFVALRVPESSVPQLADVTVHAQLTGLNSTDVTGHAEALQGIPAKAAGWTWVVLCRLPLARGDGQLTFANWPADLANADLLLCTWPRFIQSGQADDWIAGQADPLWAPSGVPLGGIGTGRVDICRDGRFRNFSGNNNQDMPFEDPAGLPGAFLAVNDVPLRPDEFTPAFPQAQLAQCNILPGVDVHVTLSGPIVPHDLTTSSLPAVLIRWRVTNTGSKPVTVRCQLAWPNLVGAGGGVGRAEGRVGYGDGSYRYWSAPHQPQTTCYQFDNVRVREYTNAPSPVSNSADGQHYVAVRGGELTLAAGTAGTVEMALVWAMPHWTDSLGVDRGLYWQNQFSDGRAIVRHVFARFDEILAGAAALPELLHDSDLPGWMASRLANCCYPLVTNSVLLRDGRFSINEGPTEMSGCYGTIDQRLAAHPATLLLFPELNRRELQQFANVMTVDGEINHDLGHGNLERGPNRQNWPDLTSSLVLQSARQAWLNADTEFATAIWPKLKLAIERAGRWADAGNGVAQLGRATGLGTSYDSYHYEGTTAYIATLWIATLQVARVWVGQLGEADFVARLDRWQAAAQQKLDADLWNGKFYRAFPGNENCHAGMLAGEFYANTLAGQHVVPDDKRHACVAAMLALQGSEQFAVPPDEVAPDGGAGSLYGWLPYIEAFCLAPCALAKYPRTLAVWERTVRALAQWPCDTRLMYRPQTGAPSWGAFYMTAPASWLVYEALIGFHYNAVTGQLRLDPQVEGRFPVVHPLFWGVGEKKGERVTLRIVRRFGAAAPQSDSVTVSSN